MATETPHREATAGELLEMWRRMLLIRRFEEEATRLLKLGKMPGVLHNTTGQEAEVVGTCMALEPNDWVLVTHRDHGHPIARGADLGPLMAEVLGKATGVCKGRGGEMHLIDPTVGVLFGSAILGSGLPVAVGTALTSQLKGTGRVTLATFGDGASNEGAVHESMNLAAIWRLPIVFVCENNGYAVTVPASYSLAIADVADRAAGYGIPGQVVEGDHPVAVRNVVRRAVEYARSGHGPSLVEIKTYRTVDHAENLPSQPYRSDDEVEEWRARDPITSFRARLVTEGHATESQLEELTTSVESEIAAAVAFALDSPDPDPSSLWDDLYVDPELNRPPTWQGAV
jgi:acetoin:2,6-dichlorophenolindophenol oxidoreductase subunit alpha